MCDNHERKGIVFRVYDKKETSKKQKLEYVKFEKNAKILCEVEKTK